MMAMAGPKLYGGRVPPLFAFFLAFAFAFVPSSALLSRQAHYGLAQRVNADGPYIGLVMADADEEAALVATGLFTPRTDLPPLEFSGRRFNVGDIFGINVIYVKSGERRMNAGITVQILLDVFDVCGIVHYGTAGSANDSLTVGDVSIPRFFAFTGSWKWTKATDAYGSQTAELEFGAFNVPMKGKNLLGKVEFQSEDFFSDGHEMEEVFWLELHGAWYKAAEQLQDLVLERCINETCSSEHPKVIAGLKSSTADIYVDNAAYRDFLFQTFEVSTVDEESAAIVMTAMSGNTPVIVFRGVSDLAGGAAAAAAAGSAANHLSASLSDLAYVNSVKASIEFIRKVGSSSMGTVSSR
ncbi:Bark storage protein [Nymphaea thermarum]|nr:Bark storage protein [Nymphaea thermarum]